MSRYPNNPYWHQDHDIPIAIMSRPDWDEAEAKGFITPEHVLHRMLNIAIHDFGTETHAGYDSEGFFTSLVADGIRLDCGITLHVYTRDHAPPHAHITIKGNPKAKVRINLRTGEPMPPLEGVRAGELKNLQRLVIENHDALAALWLKNHDEVVVLGDQPGASPDS